MGMYNNRPHAEDICKMKKRGEKITILFVSTHDAAAATAFGPIETSCVDRNLSADRVIADEPCPIKVLKFDSLE